MRFACAASRWSAFSSASVTTGNSPFALAARNPVPRALSAAIQVARPFDLAPAFSAAARSAAAAFTRRSASALNATDIFSESAASFQRRRPQTSPLKSADGSAVSPPFR